MLHRLFFVSVSCISLFGTGCVVHERRGPRYEDRREEHHEERREEHEHRHD